MGATWKSKSIKGLHVISAEEEGQICPSNLEDVLNVEEEALSLETMG